MNNNPNKQRILVLDFGSQYSQLIVRRVRESGVYCEMMPYDIDEAALLKFAPQGIILAGGPESVTKATTPRAPNVVFTLGCPVLGICYGMQTMAAQLGGRVVAAKQREFGHAQVEVIGNSLLLQHIQDHVSPQGKPLLDVWMSHGDHIEVLPANFQVIAKTENVPIAAMADERRHFYGLLFHPEVTHTLQGQRIIERFVHEICGCENLWTLPHIIEQRIDIIRQQVNDEHVMLGISGGTDSAVVAALLRLALLKEQLHCVFVDTGLLRQNQEITAIRNMCQQLDIELTVIDAAERFYTALQGISDPEQKRKIIGKCFIHEFEKAAKQNSKIHWLAQGTIYSDVIESAATPSNKSQVIKSHHNVGGLPETMQLRLLEPVRELFKDEVIRLGLELGLPSEHLYKHPFPGPGLAVRILGEVKPEYIELLRKADAIFIEELRNAGWYEKVKQAFAIFLPIKSVGVMGDARQYAYVLALRAVETVDFMTAQWAHLPYDLLNKVANRIINEIPGISRVVYDISSKPPATIEWE